MINLHFVIADTHHTRMRLIHENEYVPYRKRVVTINLTPEQMTELKLQPIGKVNGDEVYEEILDVIMEQDGKACTVKAPVKGKETSI